MALRLKKIGNALMTVVGGRDVHPVNFRVGGLYRAPTVVELRAIVPELEWARDAARELVRWTAGFDFPDYEHDYAFVSLREPGEYPIERGRLVSSTGLDISIDEYEAHFTETHVERSNALHSTLEGVGPYLVGPLARYALNFDELSDVAKEAADEVGLGPVCRNPFRSIVVRAVETLYAIDEALRIIEEYARPKAPAVECVPRAATGYGCTEAPRGICWHRYEIDADGVILDAKIVPPTSQNQKTIEDDLFGVVSRSLDLSDEQLSHLCEQTIRNYDPCISCATHFLRLEVERL
jgi:coenzyme F420-reducing hydrogenase alpha subunit